MKSAILLAGLLAASAALAQAPRPAAPSNKPGAERPAAFAPARIPGTSIDEVLKAYPSAREVPERCHHEAVKSARIDCTRLNGRAGNLGYQLELTKAGVLIRSVEYAVLKDAAEGERVFKQRVGALTQAFGKGRKTTATPAEGLQETRIIWDDRPRQRESAGVALITRAGEPAVVMDYIESRNPAHF